MVLVTYEIKHQKKKKIVIMVSSWLLLVLVSEKKSSKKKLVDWLIQINHDDGLELKVNFVFSPVLPGWAVEDDDGDDEDEEEEIGEGEMMATITEMSSKNV